MDQSSFHLSTPLLGQRKGSRFFCSTPCIHADREIQIFSVIVYRSISSGFQKDFQLGLTDHLTYFRV